MEAEVGRFESLAIVFVSKNEKQKEVSTHLVLNRTLVFSPRAPFSLILEIPKSANKNADGTAGWVWGGMPCRPPSVVCDDVIFSPECDFAFLRQFLDKVRTFFAENPEQ
jgi:hypothetical protein